MKRSRTRWGHRPPPAEASSAPPGLQASSNAPKQVKPKGYWLDAENRWGLYQRLAARLQASVPASAPSPPYFDYTALYHISRKNASHSVRAVAGNFGSVVKLLMADIPDHSWKSWRFYNPGWYKELGRGFQAGDPIARAATAEFFADLAQRMGVHQPADWTKVILRLKHENWIEHFGGWEAVLVALYGEDIARKVDVHPASPRPSRIRKELAPYLPAKGQGSELWLDSRQRFLYLSHLANQLTPLEDSSQSPHASQLPGLYSVQQHSFNQTNGRLLIDLFRSSTSAVVLNTFPEHPWQPWRFSPAPAGWWTLVSSRFRRGDPVAEVVVREYVEYLEREVLKFSSRSDWWNKNIALRTKLGREYVRFRYFGSVRAVLSKLHSELAPGSKKIIPPLFDSIVPISHWESKEHRVEFFRKLHKLLEGQAKPSSSEDWWLEDLYQVSPAILMQSGATALLSLYKGSVYSAIVDTFPDYPWRRWKFPSTPANWWSAVGVRLRANDPEALATAKELIAQLALGFDVAKLDDWYRVSHRQLSSNVSRLRALGGLPSVLAKIYPDHPWNWAQARQTAREKKSQQWQIVQSLHHNLVD